MLIVHYLHLSSCAFSGICGLQILTRRFFFLVTEMLCFFSQERAVNPVELRRENSLLFRLIPFLSTKEGELSSIPFWFPFLSTSYFIIFLILLLSAFLICGFLFGILLFYTFWHFFCRLGHTYSGRGKFMPLPLKSKILETPGFLVTDYIKMFPLWIRTLNLQASLMVQCELSRFCNYSATCLQSKHT